MLTPVTHEMPDGTRGSAELSEDGRYRYRLDRAWGDGPTVAWVMLNPSTANGRENDPTMRRLLHFSRRPDLFGRLVVVNLFAYRSPRPEELRAVDEPVGPENDRHIIRAVTEANVGGAVVAAWGAGAAFAPERIAAVRRLLPDSTLCLGRTKAGYPRHPLYVRNDTPWEHLHR